MLQLVEKNTNLSTNISGQIVILHFHSINWVFMNICWVLRNYIDRCLYRISRFFSTMDSNQCFFKPVSYFSKLNAFKQVVTTVKDYYMSYQESKCKGNFQRGWKQHLRHWPSSRAQGNQCSREHPARTKPWNKPFYASDFSSIKRTEVVLLPF